MKSIGILGCGWLGFPLAKFLKKKNYSIKVSSTNKEKNSIFKGFKLDPYVIKIHDDKIEGNLDFFNNLEILIISFPPKIKKNNKSKFDKKINLCLKQIEKNQIKKVLFISSISVYSELTGSVNENNLIKPIKNINDQLITSEKKLINNSKFKTTILRMGGLIGPGRHPVYSLINKNKILNPEGKINLIHLDDCINIIYNLILNFPGNEIFNCVCPYHPTKKEYYTSVAINKNLKLPDFDHSRSITRIVSSKKIINYLDYNFIRKNLSI